MSPTLARPPVTEAPVPVAAQPSIAPTVAETNPLNTSTGTPLAQAQSASLQDVPGVQGVMTNLVAALNGQQVSPDPRNGQFVVNMGDRREVATLVAGDPEGNSSVFHLVSTSGETLASFVVEWNSSASTHTATVRAGDAVTLTGVAPQDFGNASPSPDLNRTLSALAVALPPRSTHPDPSSLPPGSALRYRVDLPEGTFKVVQGEGSETGTHNTTEISFTGTSADEIYLQFTRNNQGQFLIQRAYVMSGDNRSESGRRPPTAEQINEVINILQRNLFRRSDSDVEVVA